jgi:sulfoxide reductase heme-binding subunit YedZ
MSIPINSTQAASLPAIGQAAKAKSAARQARRHAEASDSLQQRIALANKIIFAFCALPCLALLIGLATHGLGANPVEKLTQATGIWSLRLLWITLAITPLRVLTGWQWLARLRRIPALFGFFYACLHTLIYLTFEVEFAMTDIILDIVQKPYIATGATAFIIMIPLAFTSTDAMMRRLGGKNWRNLHRTTYLAAIIAAMHYLFLVKRDITAPAIYILILLLMFAFRVAKASKRSIRAR